MNQSLKQTITGLTPDIQKELGYYVASGEYSGVRGRDQAKHRLIGYLHACHIHAAILDADYKTLLDLIRDTDGHRIIAAALPKPEPKPEPVTKGERSLWRWQVGEAGGFESALWSAIERADSTNLAAIAQGFPEHVAAYRRYAHETGYWDNLCVRIEAR